MEENSCVKNIYKIYARLNQEEIVIKIFCDAFEYPQEKDVLIEETENRQGANDYKFINENGQFIYCWNNGLQKRKNLEEMIET